jgi:uncharacterized protein
LTKLKPFLKILIFFLVFIASFLFLSVALYTFVKLPVFLLSEISLLLSTLLSTFIMMRFFERRKLTDIGLNFTPGTKSQVYYGLILGFVMITVVVLPNSLLGYYKYDFSPRDIFPQIFEALLLFTIVAFSEEILFRGYPFQRAIDWTNPWVATLIFSSIFALAHIQNPNINSIALLNIFLAGVWLSSAFVKTRSLWLPISLHFSWNFFQGYFFSLPVSGTNLVEPLFDVEIKEKNLLSGGDFGPEASILTTFVLIISTIFILKNERLENK